MEKITASVKVMNSYDYCHFEIALSQDVDNLIDVNTLRIRAQQLVDEAVRQYKVSKEKATSYADDMRGKQRLKIEVDNILEKPKKEWTPADKAKVKAIEDDQWERNRYQYEDSGLPF